MNKKINVLDQVGYVRRYSLLDGKEEGLKICEIYNGKLRLLFNESRGFDLSQLFVDGINVSFLSKNGINNSKGDFLERFEGGMIYTCGYENIGGREGFELHGTYHLHPAKVILVERNDQEIVVKAEVVQSALFGKNLKTVREITTKIGSDTFTLKDTLVNEGTKEEDYVLLYHVNLGYPFLDEGVKIYSDAKSVTPRTPYAKECVNTRTEFLAPIDNEEEKRYFIENQTPIVKVTNERLKKEFVMTYSKETLPEFIEWYSVASKDYALGLEPATCTLDDDFKYSKIKPNEKKEFTLTISVKDV